MRTKKLQPVVDAVGLDKVAGAEVSKKTIVPSSFAGSLRCMAENFHDEVTASHAHGLPDIITNFACDLEWPEIVQGLEHGQKAVDRTDITVRVHQMKLLDYLQKISTGQVFGTVVAVVHTVEFQKRGLPHARILVWQQKNSTQGSKLTDVDDDTAATALAKTMETALPQPPRLKMGAAATTKTGSSKKN